jgi:hypothetical protein
MQTMMTRDEIELTATNNTKYLTFELAIESLSITAVYQFHGLHMTDFCGVSAHKIAWRLDDL